MRVAGLIVMIELHDIIICCGWEYERGYTRYEFGCI